jgi:hypothetical protein
MADYVFSERDYLRLKASLDKLDRENQTIKAKLRRVSSAPRRGIYMPATSSRVEWTAWGTKDTSNDGRFDAADSVTIYAGRRVGPVDIGITHDPSVSSPLTDGNFTITKAGLFEFTMVWALEPYTTGGNWSGRTWAMGRVQAWFKRGSDPWDDVDPSLTAYVSHDEAANVDATAIRMGTQIGTANFEVGDLLAFRCNGFSSTGTGCSWNLAANHCRLIVRYLGAASEAVNIP